ncbi:MAG TPA: hypothetical protein VGL91_14030 [Acidobacteriota bacterium]|jgi:hypothetical protein
MTGTCRLCQQPKKQLQVSHLLAAAFYKSMREPADKNPNPITVNPKVALKTSRQVSDYLLCAACEDRFNTGGERWILKNCWQSERDFPLQTVLLGAKPIYKSRDQFTIYEGARIAGIDMEKLIYFAASIFWRAGAHQWGPVGREDSVKLELGPYEEELRLFLMSSGHFPANMVLIVTVSSSTEAGRNQFLTFPFLKDHKAEFRQYKFVIPGVTFQMFTGKGMRDSLRGLCTVRSPKHRIYTSPTMDEMNLSDMAKMAANARALGDLK